MAATTVPSTCPSCGEEAPEGATWCEACGHELAAEVRPACVSCGEREVDVTEGYCLSCGYRQPRERDHFVVADGRVVAASDRGRRHHHNEDSVAIGRVAEPDGDRADTAVLVVCDGVSSTADSAAASAEAALRARDALVVGLAAGGAGPGSMSSDDIVELLTEAVASAQTGAAGVAPDQVLDESGVGPDGATGPGQDPPSSTLVAVVARPNGRGVELATAWVGDSRAYWVGQDETRRLTSHDHELGGGLVRWLGADSVDPTPDIEVTEVADDGVLVVCSDGLWRYAAEAEELASLVRRLQGEGRGGAELAERLVDHGNEQGGHDNITVAVWSNQPDWPVAGGEVGGRDSSRGPGSGSVHHGGQPDNPDREVIR